MFRQCNWGNIVRLIDLVVFEYIYHGQEEGIRVIVDRRGLRYEYWVVSASEFEGERPSIRRVQSVASLKNRVQQCRIWCKTMSDRLNACIRPA